MDRADGGRPSGIPRASRLPVLSKRSSQLFVNPPQLESLPPVTPRLAKRSSIAALPRSARECNNKKPPAPIPPSDITRPRLAARSSSIKSSTSSLISQNTVYNGDDDQLGALDSFRASSRQSSFDDVDNEVPRGLSAPRVRKARPSLSDRAIESIQAIPTTPKDRRQSNFFNTADSPMGPPPRPTSSMSNSHSRPGTSDGSFPKTPQTAIKMPMSAKPPTRSANGFGFAQGQRSTSLTKKLQTAKEIRPLPSNASPKDEVTVKPRRVASGDVSQSTASSSALRQQIAAAKAAAKEKRERTLHDSPQERVSHNNMDVHSDPFNQAPRDGKHVLRSRLRSARMDGKLNIAALQLKEIPEEVLNMYSAAAIEESKISWAELVDLTKFIAADNELENIPDSAFPDMSLEELQEEENGHAGQFGGLELLDLHNNILASLPFGLRRLERLTSLNVMHNRLDNSSLETISQIKTLKDLRIGYNSISGNLPSALCTMNSLEVLDIRANRLLALPEAIGELSRLRVLNVSANQLTSLPMDALAYLPLQELDASGNALIASLFPLGGESRHSTLKALNLANNSLAALTFSPELVMPELQSLDITNNHLTSLPPVHGWQKLVTLNAGDNKIAEIPDGFTELKHLRIVNFSGNELHLLPPEIAMMDSLTTFVLASNPLRNKKYLTMDAGAIKQDLRAFLKQGTDDYDDETASYGTAPEDPSFNHGWTVKLGGVLDLSNKGLTDSINDSLGSFLKSNEVRQLSLQGNKLTTIPPALWLGQDIRMLDLSNNPLEVDYLTEDLDLPSLVDLRMSTCRITRLEPLVYHLRASVLQILQINGNRLSGPVPNLHSRYPQLVTLLASDNKYETVSADALKGYNTVDLTSNELQSLPAEIGLLWEEGLKSFEVGRNAFRVPGHRVLEKGTQATMRWLQDRIKLHEVEDTN